MYTAQGAQFSAVMTQRGEMREGWEEAQEGEDICLLIADSHCCTAEINTTLLSNYPQIKKKNKKKNKNRKPKIQPNGH